MKHLILGGARSGKSGYAEACAQETGKQLVYIATATGRDSEMKMRIAKHQANRHNDWYLIEEEQDLSAAISQVNSQNKAVVIDCLTLWLSNCLADNIFEIEKRKFLRDLDEHEADLFIVSNEVGSGVVPLGELSRVFVDKSGWLHQELGRLCDKVSLVVAGLPLTLK